MFNVVMVPTGSGRDAERKNDRKVLQGSRKVKTDWTSYLACCEGTKKKKETK